MSDDPFGTARGVLADIAAADLSRLDLILLGTILLIVVGGVRVGLVRRATRLAGIALGLLLVGMTVPAVLDLVDPASLAIRSAIAVATAGATVMVVTAVVVGVTAPVRAVLRLGPLSLVDRAAGGVASGVAAVLILWLLLPAAAAIPGRVSAEVRGSAVLGAVDAVLPPQPDVTRSLRALAGLAGFPDPFMALAPTPTPTGPPPDGVGTVGARAESAGLASAVRILAIGCGRMQTGSGFALDGDLIVTNAHVIAGGRELSVRGADGIDRDAVAVAFDASRDLALLSVPGHGLAPLTPRSAEVGDLAVIVGHPGGSDTPRVATARVDRRVLGVGRDIYGDEGAERDLLFLSAELERGDSGAAVVGVDGGLLGVVFAVSPDREAVAYAVTADEVLELVDLPRTDGDAGRCI